LSLSSELRDLVGCAGEASTAAKYQARKGLPTIADHEMLT
jgi:hypothetical protein